MIDISRADGRVVLRVAAVDPSPQVESWEHGVIWRQVNAVSIALEDAHWYGQGALVHQQWPLEKLSQYPAPFLTSDNGATGLLGTLHPFWFTSWGAGVLVESGDALVTSFNAPTSGEPPFHSFTDPAPNDQRPRLAAGCETDGLLRIEGDNLTLRFFALGNVREVIEAYWSRLAISEPPPPHLIDRALWTTWAHFKNDISHEQVVEFAHRIDEYGFPSAMLGIDAKWQEAFGDTHFDPARFPNPQQTIDAIHALGLGVTLWTIPFFNADSEHYQAAIDRGYAIQTLKGGPLIGDWWEGQAVYLDVTNPDALGWHLDNLDALAWRYGLDGFKFDAGEGMFYDRPGSALHAPQAPNAANRTYVQAVAPRFPWSDVRSGWRTQDQGVLLRQWDKSTLWGYDNGLASCITQAMTLNLLGYPYSFPDMIGGNEYFGRQATGELMIRWTQAVAPMPVIQFSLAPWRFGDEVARICARYARLHAELGPRTYRTVQRQVPIVRPVWWLAPQDEDALTCADEYLVGPDLLAAPVITEGADRRDIYLPPGRWRSYWDHDEVHQGSGWLADYPAPLETLPLFERVGSG